MAKRLWSHEGSAEGEAGGSKHEAAQCMWMTPTGKADEKPEYSLGIIFVVMIFFVFIWFFFSIKRKYSLAFELYALFSSCCKTWRVVKAVMSKLPACKKALVFSLGASSTTPAHQGEPIIQEQKQLRSFGCIVLSCHRYLPPARAEIVSQTLKYSCWSSEAM